MRQQKNDPVEGRFHRVASPVSRRYRRIRRPRRRSSTSNSVLYRQFRRLLELVNDNFDLGLEIPETLKLFQLSEQHRRLVVINVQGLRRKNGSLLPEYTEEEFNEATFIFVKYYIQGRHYDELVEENKKLQFELDQEVEWRNRTDNG